MDVWLKIDKSAKTDSSDLRLTHSPRQAMAMSQDNARKAMQGAKRDYPQYKWEMESGFGSGEFMLHGHDKDGTARKIVSVLPQERHPIRYVARSTNYGSRLRACCRNPRKPNEPPRYLPSASSASKTPHTDCHIAVLPSSFGQLPNWRSEDIRTDK
jgi:hypothetical protein